MRLPGGRTLGKYVEKHALGVRVVGASQVVELSRALPEDYEGFSTLYIQSDFHP